MPNPLLRRVPAAEMSPQLRAEYEESKTLQESKGGDATFYEIGANAPHMLDWYFHSFYEKVFYGGRVDVRTKELLRYRLSMTHGCAFCNKGNIEAARRAGVTEDQLRDIMNEESEAFSNKDRAVLRLAAQVVLTNMHGELTPDLHAELSEHYDDGQIFEMGMVAGVLTGAAKFLFVFDLVEKEANCPVFPRAAAE